MASCPFCLENGHVSILFETRKGYLVQAKRGQEVLHGRYLIIPKQHTTKLLCLPADWQLHLNELLEAVPEVRADKPYNLSVNMGYAAGQRVAHIHFWVIIRDRREMGHKSENLGLHSLIENA